jgi:cytoskeletal protein CcmA (bactofilin family)
MFTRKTDKPQNRIDSLIGAGTRVEGAVTFTGGLRVDGEVKGSVSVAPGETGTLVVSEQARIEGEIRCTRLVVNGTVVGPIHVTDTVELHPRSKVTGDVHYAKVEMHLGAIVDGRLVFQASEAKTVELKLASGG